MSAPKATKYQELKDSLHKFLHSDNPVANTLKMAETYTKVDRKYIALGKLWYPSRTASCSPCRGGAPASPSSPPGLVAFLVLYIMIGWGAALVVNLIGFVYPAYASYVCRASMRVCACELCVEDLL